MRYDPEKLERNANIDRVKEETLQYFKEKTPSPKRFRSSVQYNKGRGKKAYIGRGQEAMTDAGRDTAHSLR